MAQGGAVGSRRIPARKGFSALAIAGSSSLTLIAMGEGYHEAAPDYQRAITLWQRFAGVLFKVDTGTPEGFTHSDHCWNHVMNFNRNGELENC